MCQPKVKKKKFQTMLNLDKIEFQKRKIKTVITFHMIGYLR